LESFEPKATLFARRLLVSSYLPERISEPPEEEALAWRPILDGALGERVFEAIQAIADSLRGESLDKVQDASLAGGHAGLAALFAYLDLAECGDNCDETAVQFLQQAIDAVSASAMTPSLYSGFAGVAWAVEHLKGGPLDPDAEDVNEEIDEALKECLSQSPWDDDYDLISGLVGFGVYMLERSPRPSAIECLERIVDRLDETAERNASGITWHTHPNLIHPAQREVCPDGYYNLGLAHGVPGVIAFLGQVWAAGIARDRVRPLLDGAVRWLLAQKPPRDAGSRFSSWIAPGSKQERSRLAWCYGDLGAAAALLVAARHVGEHDWEREALEIARQTTNRPLEQSGIVDAGLCHGAAGLGHIYNRIFQAAGEARFREAARFWFEHTLNMRRPGQGIAGFSAFMPKELGEEQWADDPGILTGAAGIALALLSAVAPIEPEWDRMLLVSIPSRT
jgi:lantibiotic biosynthesis protein